jgi:hypothetical protein
MALKRSFLVVANVTAASDELLDVLEARARSKPSSFRLIVPATPFGGGRAAATQKVNEALARLTEAGLDVDGSVGNADPIVAVTDAWDPKRFDEIIISTLPTGSSKWLRAGLPERVAKITGAPVTHLVSHPPKPEAAAAPAPTPEKRPLGPLSVLGWGGAKRR